MKKILLIGILMATGLAAGIMLYIGKRPVPIIILGCLSAFLLYALLDPPSKHKTFSYRDQQKGTARALGGSGPPELPEPDRTGKIIKPNE